MSFHGKWPCGATFPSGMHVCGIPANQLGVGNFKGIGSCEE